MDDVVEWLEQLEVVRRLDKSLRYATILLVMQSFSVLGRTCSWYKHLKGLRTLLSGQKVLQVHPVPLLVKPHGFLDNYLSWLDP